jgi:hypothetical protein
MTWRPTRPGSSGRLPRRRRSGRRAWRRSLGSLTTSRDPGRRHYTAQRLELEVHGAGRAGTQPSVQRDHWWARHGEIDVAGVPALSAWMKARLRLALRPHDAVAELDTIETDVLGQLLPPLNLDKVVTPWRNQVKAARKLLAAEAWAWRPS